MEQQPDKTPRHPIGVVVRRTGIPQDLLRAWERRYEAVVPGRSDSGRRLYSDLDVIRLRLLKRAVDGGRRISDVARLPLTELHSLAAEDQNESVPAPALPVADPPVDALLAESIEAIENLDRTRLERALNEGAVTMSTPMLRQRLIVPLMHAIGDRWRDGTIRVAQEHLATAIVRRFVDGLRNGGGPQNAPRLVVTTPAGHLHELGALVAAAAAEESGWQAIYLGPNTPAEEIAAATRQLGARGVALSVAYAADDRKLGEEINKIRKLLDPAVALIVGGRGLDPIATSAIDSGIVHLEDLSDFQLELEKLLTT